MFVVRETPAETVFAAMPCIFCKGSQDVSLNLKFQMLKHNSSLSDINDTYIYSVYPLIW